jgi:chondroitin-sulfate-ABC endolyase/exolyase
MDIDAFNTSLMGRVASVLMLEDTPYKYAYLKAVSRWIDNGFKHTEGLRPCFKTDGSIVHHRKCYPAYAVGGFSGAVNAVWMLAGTGLAVSEESHSNLKEALLAMQFYSYRELFPLAMSGRHPDGKWSLSKEQYYRLALAGSPDRQENIDKDLAYAYLTLLRDYERGDGYITLGYESLTKEMKYLKDNGIDIQDAERPSGTRTFGFNCSMSHRHEGRLVTIAGHSRYLWAAEIYQNANHHGRYLTHGSMQILAPEEPGRVGGGFRQEGWDWCHIPGTTAAVLDMHDMKANVLNVDEYSGYEEMLLSDEWFAGGVTHKGKSGAYAMKLHEHDKYNGSLRARKSFFTFQNRIICLGTDIENALKGAPVHTTLFQNYVGNAPSWEPMPVEGRSNILRDHSNALYFVNGGKIHFSVGLQQSLHEETDNLTEGYFEKAYIEHGDVIKDGTYEYMVYMPTFDDAFQKTGMDSIADTIERYAADLPYKVLRKETNIHGVLDIPSGIKAFAVFEQGAVDETILECSPAMVMYSVEEGTMTLSVSNPDLALYEGPSDEILDENGKRIERSIYSRKWVNNPCADTKVYMTLSGLWKIENADGVKIVVKHNNGNTVLEFTSKEARTEEVTLKKIN